LTPVPRPPGGLGRRLGADLAADAGSRKPGEGRSGGMGDLPVGVEGLGSGDVGVEAGEQGLGGGFGSGGGLGMGEELVGVQGGEAGAEEGFEVVAGAGAGRF